ncbi:MAG TPA: phosphomannomutase/phosphoglucomutase [Candidatus Nanoarchaeia archaeon]|nr:phosphomannomutase/phosphoglucomutase [Candidatus Nanoarchaeia archaeon]
MGAFTGYDIRGIYPTEINEELAYKAGRAITQFLKAKQILVGRDCRTSSLSLKKSLIYGITDQGCNVTDINYCSTPMSYYAAQKMHSLMITASHNPKEYNGIKITAKGVDEIGQHNGLQQIEKLTLACHFKEPKKRGKVNAKNILPEYVKYVRKLVNGKYKALRILIDCGNGMAGYVVPSLLKGLPIKYKLLYGEMDGTFPNHIPNPAIPENTADLQKEVVKGKYDLGIAYDGDCDRVFFVDEKGRRVRSEYALILFAQHEMKKGQAMIYTVNSSRIVREKMQEMGCKAYPSRIGHTEIPLTMQKHKGILAGEITGHFYFKKFKNADSGDIGALMMLSVLSQSGKKMSELIKPFDKYATSEEINYKVKDKDTAIKRVEQAYKKQVEHRIDGISFDAGDYWFNLRLSKTENLVRLNVEAVNQKKLRQAIEWITRLIQG